MSKIKALEFAEYVDSNRKRLIDHCINNNKSIDPTASLGEAVSIASTINNPDDISEETFEVLYIDIDGTVLQRTEVHSGDPVPAPPPDPNYDPEYLVFKGWVRSKGSEIIDGVDTVLHDMDIGAVYDTVPITVDGVEMHPAIIKHSVSAQYNNLKQTLGAGSNVAKSVLYVDWGDGTPVEQKELTSTSNTYSLTHTYQTSGEYVTKVYCNNPWYFMSNCKILNSNYYLTEFYMGSDIYKIAGYFCQNLHNLKVIALSNSLQEAGMATLTHLYSLKAIIIPCSFRDRELFEGCTALQYLVIPEDYAGYYTLPALYWFGSFNRSVYPVSLKRLIVPNNLIEGLYIGDGSYQNMYSLEVLNLPKSATQVSNKSLNMQYKSLKRIVLPENLVTLNMYMPVYFDMSRLLQYKHLTTLSCNLLGNISKTIIIPDSVLYLTLNSIPYGTTIHLNENVETVGLFGYSTNLYGVVLENIPDSVTTCELQYVYLACKEYSTSENMRSCKLTYMQGDLERLVINQNVESIKLPYALYKLKSLLLYCAPSALTEFSLQYMPNLEELVIPKDLNVNINIGANTGQNISNVSLINMAKNLKDRTGSSALTLSIRYTIHSRLLKILVDTEGNETTIDNPDAITLKQFIQNKNWTISNNI